MIRGERERGPDIYCELCLPKTNSSLYSFNSSAQPCQVASGKEKYFFYSWTQTYSTAVGHIKKDSNKLLGSRRDDDIPERRPRPSSTKTYHF